MESILNTITKSEVQEIGNDLGQFSLKVNYEKNSENINSDFLELYPISTDEVEIITSMKRKNGTLGIEGDILINHSKDAIFYIDIDGSLNVTDYHEEKYNIDSQGNLIINL